MLNIYKLLITFNTVIYKVIQKSKKYKNNMRNLNKLKH